MNDLDQAPLLLLVCRAEAESDEELLAMMRTRYDVRVRDTELGPLYKIGPSYIYQGQSFSQIRTFAGSLVIRIVFDTRQGKFGRSVIYRFGLERSLRLLHPGGPESDIDEHGFALSQAI